jgi:hypothetical protein
LEGPVLGVGSGAGAGLETGVGTEAGAGAGSLAGADPELGAEAGAGLWLVELWLLSAGVELLDGSVTVCVEPSGGALSAKTAAGAGLMIISAARKLAMNFFEFCISPFSLNLNFASEMMIAGPDIRDR